MEGHGKAGVMKAESCEGGVRRSLPESCRVARLGAGTRLQLIAAPAL